jgi:hypothetical protein
MKLRLALRLAAYASLLLTAMVMLYPAKVVLGVDLSDQALQTALFSITAFLFAIIENPHPVPYSPFVAADNLSEVASVRWGRHIARVAILCVLYAGLLELGQWIDPPRHAGVMRFAENAGSIIVTMVLTYGATRVFASNYRIRRAARTTLSRAAEALRSEANYSGLLRDSIQEAYAISFSDLPAEERVAGMSSLLSEALGAAPPIHDEGVLNAAFGARRRPERNSMPHVKTAEIARSKARAH